jgi:CRISPR-associated endonuclease Csn1
MKRILGLDLGTNSIGWSLINSDFEKKEGEILGIGSRIIPMSQDILGKFDSGESHSQTAERTGYRGIRRLYQRDNLRRERLHRVLNVIGFLPEHYKAEIDFEKHLGQFKEGKEPKINYRKNENGKHEFIFMNSFQEMAAEFKARGLHNRIPYDWTLYYLRKKALSNKITKQELAWLILNFNQKRGYYQLRGEEEETDNAKREEFYALKVKDIQATEDTNAKGTWYNVVLENDWVYRRQSKEPLPWAGKMKEFVITTQLEKDGSEKLDKDGNIKRSFRAVDSEKDWIAIKKKTEKDIEQSKKHIGEYIYETLLSNPSQKIRGKLIKTIERKYYRAELQAILTEQTNHHPELRDKELYFKCIAELYPRNEAHANNIKDKKDFFNYLFIEDIIFYQRPLKSKKSTISNCQYETRFYKDKKTGEVREITLKGIPKSHPLYQEFRLWQFLKNLRVYKKEQTINGKTELNVDVTKVVLPNEEAYVELFDWLSSKKELEQHQLLKFFSDKKLIPKQKKDEPDYRWNYPEDKKYPMGETRAGFISRLSKVKNVNAVEFLTKEMELHLWHIVYSVKDKAEFEMALKTFAKRYGLDCNSFVDSLKRYPPFKNEYGSYSEKALKKLLPLMRLGKYWSESRFDSKTLNRIKKLIDGEFDEQIKNRIREKVAQNGLNKIAQFKGLPTWLACYVVYDRHSESATDVKWNSPADIDKYLNDFKQHSLRNPIVEQVVTETLRVVRDIWKYYGESAKEYFNEIHIELGRAMKNPKEKRERIANKQKENENTNHRIKEILKELMNDGVENVKSYSPSHQEILKIYEEGIFENSTDVYRNVKIDEIEKIRKNTSPSKKDIQRYKLWLEQGYVSPYTGEIIKLSDLFTEKYQIEHIIPQSRYFDDSTNNKVICESEINPNPYKDNQTGFEFIKNMGGSLIPELSRNGKTVKLFTLEEYENHCRIYFKQNRNKLKNLLSEDIPEGFIERQLNDSRYISKLIKGLMSNIVKEEGELEAISKNVVPVTGAITSKLKQDWGLNDKWNELILPRFKRLNELTDSEDFTTQNTNGVTIPTVPDSLSKGFNKKRIDHKHHALDALVIASCTKEHINYITSLNTQRNNYGLVSKLRKQKEVIVDGKKRMVAKEYKKPWDGYPVDAKNALEKMVVSFKQNLRVINKANNKTWQWVNENGELKKKLVKQTKGDNWSIRKPLHKETVSGKFNIDVPKGKIATATRTALTEIKNEKHLAKITDKQIREVILPNHLDKYLDENGKPNYELAFGVDGIEELNKNIQSLNNGKRHAPIFKVPMFEVGSKFPISENPKSTKNKKYVEAAKGTNLYFTVYQSKNKRGETIRQYETIPLNEVVEHQKQVAQLPKEERTPIPVKPAIGELLFTLSPNDLVYVPTDEELENPNLVDWKNLTREQVERIYKTVSSSGSQCFFVRNDISTSIKNKFEFSALNKMEKAIDGTMIKERCWKLKVDRLGNISRVER